MMKMINNSKIKTVNLLYMGFWFSSLMVLQNTSKDKSVFFIIMYPSLQFSIKFKFSYMGNRLEEVDAH